MLKKMAVLSALAIYGCEADAGEFTESQQENLNLPSGKRVFNNVWGPDVRRFIDLDENVVCYKVRQDG